MGEYKAIQIWKHLGELEEKESTPRSSMTMTHLIQRNSLNKESKERVIKTKNNAFIGYCGGKRGKKLENMVGLDMLG